MDKIVSKILGLCLLLTCIGRFAEAQNITVDGYFNNETKKDKNGMPTRFHYTWDNTDDPGFSKFGRSFKMAGAKVLTVLTEKPSLSNLKNTQVFILVDPDNLKDNPEPNYISETDASTIAKWVKAGGILLILANDSANTDLDHLNILAARFGIRFNKDMVLHVTDDAHFANGGLNTTGIPLFKTARRIFMKDVCSISVQKPAAAILKDKNGANVFVSASYGKGTVLAAGDPWLYNEYTNGRLPLEYENDKAANDLAAWLIQKIPGRKPIKTDLR